MVRRFYWRDVLWEGDIVDLSSVGPEGVILPGGTTGQRPPAPTEGTLRYNTTITGTEVYQNGVWAPITTAGTTGFSTAANLGTGQGILITPVVLPNLQFKSLIPGTGVSFVVTPTDIRIDAPGIGEANTAANVGSGIGVFESKVGVNLNFRSIATTTPGQIQVSNSGGGEVLVNFIGTLGEINTGSNLGGGSQVFESKVGTTLRFRSITSGGAPITVTQNANDIAIAMSANPVIPGTASMTIPTGTTGAEPAPVNGMIRYDTTLQQFRAVINGVWATISTVAGTFLPLSGGSMTGNLTMSGGSDILLGAGSDITLAGGTLFLTSGSGLNMSAGGNITMAPGATIDSRDVSADGLVMDSINGAGNGIVVKTNSNVFNRRTLTGTANQITITNGDGVGGNPTFAITTDPVIPGTGAITIPSGSDAQRPGSPTNAMIRMNTDSGLPEYFFGGGWNTFISSVGGEMRGNLVLNTGNIVMTGSETVDGRDLSQDGVVIDQINAVSNNSGVLVRSGSAVVSRLITPAAGAHLNGINVANGNGAGVIEIGLDINGLPAISGLSLSDSIVVYDDSSSANTKATISDFASFVGTAGLDSLFLNTIGDTQNGDIRMDGANMTFTNNRASAVGLSGNVTGLAGSITINGIGPITINAGSNAGVMANAINSFPGIISDGTIVADSVGSPSALRIYKTGGGSLILIDTTGTPLTDMGITPTTYSAIGRVDGRDVSADGAVLDNINTATQFGFVTRTADGAPATFARRSITASAVANSLGLSVTNGNGVVGDPEIGLNITGLTNIGTLAGTDEVPVYDQNITTNRKASMNDMLRFVRANSNNTMVRAQSLNLAVPNGLTAPINFTTVTFDNDSSFNNLTDVLTIPVTGIYRMTAYVEVGATTVAGRYLFRMRRNGTAEGNTGIVVANAADPVSAFADDLFRCTAGESWTVELNNTSGSASTLVAIRWIVQRVF
jgi:hypothetical protein